MSAIRERGQVSRVCAAIASVAITAAILPASFAEEAEALGPCSGTWTVSPADGAPIEVLQTMLNGISIDGSVGWTVGGVTDLSNTFHAFADRFDGSGWSLGSPVDAAEGADTWLNDVVTFDDGPSGAPEAWAVGYAGPSSTLLRPQMLIEHWVGPDPSAPWQLTAPTADASFSNLISVSGTSATDVWAVGSTRTGVTYRPLIMHFDGDGWRSVPGASLPASTTASGLVSVSAATPSDVWAVGWRTNGTRYRTLAQHWDGTAWTTVSTPDPGSVENVLLGVVSVGKHAWAVGYRKDVAGPRGLVLRYGDRGWITATAPGPYTELDVLRSVTVDPSTGSVWAAGFGFDETKGYQPLVVTTDPTDTPLSWTRTNTAIGDDAEIGNQFKDITAEPTGGQLWAVGPGPSRLPLVETICPSTAVTAMPTPEEGAREVARSEASAVSGPAAPIATGSAAEAASAVIATDVAPAALPGEPPLVRTNGAVVGDLAGPGGAGADGYQDLLIGRFGDAPMELWINQHDGTWEQVAAGAFPTADRYGCTFGELGSPSSPSPDGLTDIFCTIGAAKGTGIKVNEVWIQRRDGSFARPATQPGVLDPFGRGRTAAMFYPGERRDGRSLFVGQQLGRGDGVPTPNRFFMPDAAGRLVDTPAAGLDLETGSSCVQPVDVDRDRLVDLLVCTNLSRLALFHNQGAGRDGVPSFVEVSRQARIAHGGVVFGLMRDLNADRCPDLVEVYAQRLDVLAQQVTSAGECQGSFVRAWSRPLRSGRSVAAGDANGDGRVDLYVLQGGEAPDLMLMNDGGDFSSVPLPQATAGSGDVVEAVRDRDTKRVDFLVLNGDHAYGPVQLIRFLPNPPDAVVLTETPPDDTTTASATYAFTSSVGSGFLCSLDGDDPEPCESGITYRDLRSGDHRFAVWAVDTAGAPLAQATDAFKVVA